MDEVYEALQQEYEYQRENGFNSTTIDGMTGFILGEKPMIVRLICCRIINVRFL